MNVLPIVNESTIHVVSFGYSFNLLCNQFWLQFRPIVCHASLVVCHASLVIVFKSIQGQLSQQPPTTPFPPAVTPLSADLKMPARWSQRDGKSKDAANNTEILFCAIIFAAHGLSVLFPTDGHVAEWKGTDHVEFDRLEASCYVIHHHRCGCQPVRRYRVPELPFFSL